VSREKQSGWSGVDGLPRTLWLGEDGTLRMRPVAELEALRSHERSWEKVALAAGEARGLEGVVGDSFESNVEIDAGNARQWGVRVRASPDREEETLLDYDADDRQLVFDSTRSGVAGRKVVERAPFALRAGERLTLRVFVDKSVVEVFANDRQPLGRRVYPGRDDSLGVALFVGGHGTAKFRATTAWEMATSNPL
jgi:beta-fructofuranosidase